jgi:rhodanese-related sulfurtransferase
MNFRYKFSIVLICLGIVAAIMSFRDSRKSVPSPRVILELLLSGQSVVSSDQVAKFVIEKDSGIQFIDIRKADEFSNRSIPGAINIPFSDLLMSGNEVIFNQKSLKTILYENGDQESTQAWILALQAGYSNIYIMQGGLAAWDSIIMKSEFNGDKISPQENSVLEKRYKARRLFSEWNTLPDSLKAGFYVARQKKEKELVGGCE